MMVRRKEDEARSPKPKPKILDLNQGKPSPTVIRVTLKGEEKQKLDILGEDISATLIRFLEPWHFLLTDQKKVDTYVPMGILAWNFTLMPTEKGKEMLEHAMKDVPAEQQEACRETFAEMMARKREHFANVKYVVLEYEASPGPSGLRLSVFALPLPEPGSAVEAKIDAALGKNSPPTQPGI